jgi:hypothetical protein
MTSKRVKMFTSSVLCLLPFCSHANEEPALALSDSLLPGEVMPVGETIFSQSGRTYLVMQPDGNLVLYCTLGSVTPIWSAKGTFGKTETGAFMQPDGNFVVYDSNFQPIWSSGTNGKNGAWIKVQNDGNLVIYKRGSDGTSGSVWASNTSGKCR